VVVSVAMPMTVMVVVTVGRGGAMQFFKAYMFVIMVLDTISMLAIYHGKQTHFGNGVLLITDSILDSQSRTMTVSMF